MSGLFGKKTERPEPVRMPDREDPTIKRTGDAERRRIMARSGRSSTNLAGSGTNSGSTSYGSSLLGQ